MIPFVKGPCRLIAMIDRPLDSLTMDNSIWDSTAVLDIKKNILEVLFIHYGF